MNVLIAAVLLLGASTSCSHSDAPVVIRVFRDIHASFVEELKRADLQFSTTQPRVKSGKPVIVATNEGTSFQFLLTQFRESAPDVVIFDSQADIVPPQLEMDAAPTVPANIADCLEVDNGPSG